MKLRIKISTIDELRHFCEIANRYDMDVVVNQGRWYVSGKSMMGLMSLSLLDELNVELDENSDSAKNIIDDIRGLGVEV